MAVTANSTSTSPTHHGSLSDGNTTFGFNFCDANGERNQQAFRAAPYPGRALKITSGTGGKYGDLQPPFMATVQDDWSGGRGSETFEDDATRFFDNFRTHTIGKGLVLGGQPHYCTGYRSVNQAMPEDEPWKSGKVAWKSLYGATRFLARSFASSATYTNSLGYCYVRIGAGTPGTLSYAIYDNNSGVPGSQLAAGSLTAANMPDRLLSSYEYFTLSQALTSGATYWVVWSGASTDNAANFWEIGIDAAASGKKSTNGTAGSWGSQTGVPYFRLTDSEAAFIPHFFEYKGQLYFATQSDAGGAGKIYMNGYRGACDDNSSYKSDLEDATASFGTDCVGAYAKIVAGPASIETRNWRKLTARSATDVTGSPAWNITHTTSDDYVILGTNRWTLLSQGTSSHLDAPVTDVEVANGQAFFAQSTKYQVLQHQEYNNAGAWKSDTSSNCWVLSGANADQIVARRDQVSGYILYFGSNSRALGDYYSRIFQSRVPSQWTGSLSLSGMVLYQYATSLDEQAVTNVDSDVLWNYAHLRVKVGVIQTLNATPTAGGSGYQAGDLLTIVDGNGLSGTCTVDTIGGGGAVTAVSLYTAGYDYSTGTGKVTTGGHGTSCTVNITAITSFTTGVIGSKAISQTDMRFYNRLAIEINTDQALNAGDLEFVMDDSANCGSPIVNVDLPSYRGAAPKMANISFDISGTVGADKVISWGLNLTAAQTRTVNIYLRVCNLHNDYDPVSVGESGENVTNLIAYGDPETVVIFSEGEVGEFTNNQYLPWPLHEIRGMRSGNTGLAALVHDVYLYFSLGNGKLQRYFRQTLEDVGPDHDAGMPSDRQGNISALAGWPGRVYAAIDGGASNYSSVLCFKGGAWHEVYRSPRTGLRIRALYIQAIPGSMTARLWIGEGSDVLWVPISLNPYYDSDFRYVHEGTLTTGYIYSDRADIYKAYKRMKLFVDGCSATHQEIYLDYRIDDDTTWTAVSGAFNTDPVQARDIAAIAPSCRRIQFRYRLRTDDNTKTPRLVASVVEGIMFDPVKHQYSFTFKLTEGEGDIDLEGDENPIPGLTTAEGKWAKLLEWANGGRELTWNSIMSPFDNKKVILDPAALMPLRIIPDDQSEAHIVQATVVEI